MIHIEDNPQLTLDAIIGKIKTPFVTVVIGPALEKIAMELSDYFIHHVFKFEKDGKEVSIEEAIRLNLFNFQLNIETKLKSREWILITEDEVYCSAGNSTIKMNYN